MRLLPRKTLRIGRWIGLTLFVTAMSIITGFIVVAVFVAVVMNTGGSMDISGIHALLAFGVLCVGIYAIGCVVHDRLAA